jgi:hypothetical protein
LFGTIASREENHDPIDGAVIARAKMIKAITVPACDDQVFLLVILLLLVSVLV